MLSYAHTCEPCSGITVKRTLSSSRRIHVSFPRDDNEAVNSCYGCYRDAHRSMKTMLTRESADVPYGSFEPHCDFVGRARLLRRHGRTNPVPVEAIKASLNFNGPHIGSR